MDNNDTSFIQDIEKFSKKRNKDINIQNCDLNLNLIQYNEIGIVEPLKNWKLYLGMIGKNILFKSKDVWKVLYCYLSDAMLLESINGNKVDIDLYDKYKNRFYRLETVNEKERNIKIKIFPICNNMIVIDNKNPKSYKIYELYNLNLIKDYYDTNKVNFDQILKDIKLNPFFTGNVDELENDFKKLSVVNYKIDHGELIEQIEKFLSNSRELDKNIMKEYKKFYNSAKYEQNQIKILTHSI